PLWLACPVWDWPVVDLLSAAPFCSAFMSLPWPSTFMSLPLLPSAFMSLPPWPSAFMSLAFRSLPPLLSFSELMLFDFGPWALSSARWFLAAPGDLSSDCVAFMSDEGFDWAAECPRSEDGALCWALEPGCSRFPVPCALAKPAPAISATAATDIIKRLVIECLLSVF